MSDKHCPTEEELLRFVDADLPPEQLARIEKHLELCSACAKGVVGLNTLVADIAEPLSSEQPLDLAPHVAGVMQRLDAPVATPRGARTLAWCGGLAVAAALLLLFAKLPGRGVAGPEGEFAARGGPSAPSLSRNVGVQLYAQQQTLVALKAGSQVTAKTELTAGLRNLGSERVYLLLFAIDAVHAVHWIAPEYTSEGSNPEAVTIPPVRPERLLASAAAFDDLALGPLSVMALISPTPLHVSDIEALPPAELAAPALRRRFTRAEVRELSLEVR